MLQVNVTDLYLQFHEQLMHRLEEDERIVSLNDLVQIMEEHCSELGCRLIEMYVGVLQDRLLQKKKERRAAGLSVHDAARTKAVLTSLGMVYLPEVVYRDAATGTYVGPVLDALGIRPHQRLSGEMDAQLAEASTEMSFRLAAKFAADDAVTRQTVRSAAYRLPVPERYTGPAEQDVQTLDFYADEEHYWLQLRHTDGKKVPKRKSRCLPVGVISEGVADAGSGRRLLVHRQQFAAESLKGPDIVSMAEGYVCSRYDLTKLEKITVHGDGALWIHKAFEDFPQTVYALDGFHLTRAVKHFLRNFGDRSYVKRAERILDDAIASDARETADILIDTLAWTTADPEIQKKVKQFRKYLDRYWAAMVERRKPGTRGSCTEAQVQHTLSCRLTSRPCSWSPQGAAKMAMLRVYLANGGSLRHPDPQDKPAGTYAALAEEAIRTATVPGIDWSIFEHESVPVLQPAGTQHLLRMYAHGGSPASGQ